MKKPLIILIVTCLLLSLAACTAQPGNPAQQTTTAPTETTPEVLEDPTQEETTEETIAPVAEGVQGTVLYNEDNFALVYQGFSEAVLPENATRKERAAFKEGQAMTVTAINRTDMKVYMRLMNLSVNSYMFETLPTVALEPGEVLEKDFVLSYEELEFNGIKEITDLQFNLWVYDSVDFKTPDVADGLCRFYANGKGAVIPRRQQLPTDQVLVRNDRYCVTVTEVTVGEDVVLNLQLQNFSDKELLFIAPYGTVNDSIIDPLWAVNVSAHKQRNTVITFPAAELKEAEITEILTVQLPIQIGDHEDWSAGAYFYEVFDIVLPQPEQPEQTEEA